VLLHRAECVSDVATDFDPAYGQTNYDYVLDLNAVGVDKSIAIDLTSGLWHKGLGKSRDEYVAQWKHNIVDVPLRNPRVLTIWHYGLQSFEKYKGKEVGRFLIESTGLKPSQYLYLDRRTEPVLPSDLRVMFLPFYDDNDDFNKLTQELKSLAPESVDDRLAKSKLYCALRMLASRFLASRQEELGAREIHLLDPDAPEALARQFEEYLPVAEYRTAAGDFRADGRMEIAGWVRVPTGTKLEKGMFVARVKGHSMEPKIPDGAFCIFKKNPAGFRLNRIVLARLVEQTDPETGGEYTVKVYSSTKVVTPDGWRHKQIVLSPINKDYDPIVLAPDFEGSVEVVAEFVAVLSPT
jgi:SOS-response transcriptional repressor LexA